MKTYVAKLNPKQLIDILLPEGDQGGEQKGGEVRREDVIADKVAVHLILDRSGSMGRSYRYVENQLIDFCRSTLLQIGREEELPLSITFFDHKADTVQCDTLVSLKQALATHSPRGGTSISIGYQQAKSFIVNKLEQSPDVRVLNVLLTDGDENNTRVFGPIKQLLENGKNDPHLISCSHMGVGWGYQCDTASTTKFSAVGGQSPKSFLHVGTTGDLHYGYQHIKFEDATESFSQRLTGVYLSELLTVLLDGKQAMLGVDVKEGEAGFVNNPMQALNLQPRVFYRGGSYYLLYVSENEEIKPISNALCQWRELFSNDANKIMELLNDSATMGDMRTLEPALDELMLFITEKCDPQIQASLEAHVSTLLTCLKPNIVHLQDEHQLLMLDGTPTYVVSADGETCSYYADNSGSIKSVCGAGDDEIRQHNFKKIKNLFDQIIQSIAQGLSAMNAEDEKLIYLIGKILKNLSAGQAFQYTEEQLGHVERHYRRIKQAMDAAGRDGAITVEGIERQFTRYQLVSTNVLVDPACAQAFTEVLNADVAAAGALDNQQLAQAIGVNDALKKNAFELRTAWVRYVHGKQTANGLAAFQKSLQLHQAYGKYSSFSSVITFEGEEKTVQDLTSFLENAAEIDFNNILGCFLGYAVHYDRNSGRVAFDKLGQHVAVDDVRPIAQTVDGLMRGQREFQLEQGGALSTNACVILVPRNPYGALMMGSNLGYCAAELILNGGVTGQNRAALSRLTRKGLNGVITSMCQPDNLDGGPSLNQIFKFLRLSLQFERLKFKYANTFIQNIKKISDPGDVIVSENAVARLYQVLVGFSPIELAALLTLPSVREALSDEQLAVVTVETYMMIKSKQPKDICAEEFAYQMLIARNVSSSHHLMALARLVDHSSASSFEELNEKISSVASQFAQMGAGYQQIIDLLLEVITEQALITAKEKGLSESDAKLAVAQKKFSTFDAALVAVWRSKVEAILLEVDLFLYNYCDYFFAELSIGQLQVRIMHELLYANMIAETLLSAPDSDRSLKCLYERGEYFIQQISKGLDEGYLAAFEASLPEGAANRKLLLRSTVSQRDNPVVENCQLAEAVTFGNKVMEAYHCRYFEDQPYRVSSWDKPCAESLLQSLSDFVRDHQPFVLDKVTVIQLPSLKMVMDELLACQHFVLTASFDQLDIRDFDYLNKALLNFIVDQFIFLCDSEQYCRDNLLTTNHAVHLKVLVRQYIDIHCFLKASEILKCRDGANKKTQIKNRRIKLAHAEVNRHRRMICADVFDRFKEYFDEMSVRYQAIGVEVEDLFHANFYRCVTDQSVGRLVKCLNGQDDSRCERTILKMIQYRGHLIDNMSLAFNDVMRQLCTLDKRAGNTQLLSRFYKRLQTLYKDKTLSSELRKLIAERFIKDDQFISFGQLQGEMRLAFKASGKKQVKTQAKKGAAAQERAQARGSLAFLQERIRLCRGVRPASHAEGAEESKASAPNGGR